MKLTASGGTDGANIVLFWPDNLPDDADQRLKDDPVSLLEQMRDEGKLVWFPCEGDGAYDVAIFVDEPVPPHLADRCDHDQDVPRLTVRGTGYFGGAEYLFKRDDRLRRKFLGMTEAVAIPDGTYGASVYQVRVPDEAAWVAERAGRSASRVRRIHGVVSAVAVAAVLATAVTGCLAPRGVWVPLSAFAVATVVAALVLSRTPAYRRAAEAAGAFGPAFPAYVVRLTAVAG